MKTRRSAALAAATAVELLIAILIAVLIHNSAYYNDNFVDLNSEFKTSKLKEYTHVRIVPEYVSVPYDTDSVKASYLLGITDSDCDFKFLVRLEGAEGTVEEDSVIEGHLMKPRQSVDMLKKFKKEGFNADEANALLLPYSIVQTELPSTNSLWTVLGISGAVYLVLFIILIPKRRTNPS